VNFPGPELAAPALLALAALSLCACPKQNDEANPDDRLLAKLKAESDRLANGGPAAQPPAATLPPEDPNAGLAQLAAAGAGQDGKRRLPAENATVHVGTVAVKLLGLATSHTTAGTGKIALTTEDLFLRVELAAQNVGTTPATLDFSFARLKAKERTFELARDVQRAAGTRELKREFPLSERVDLTLYFEVPKDAFGSELKLVFPSSIGGNADLEVPLE
jgi:hypothetical protein